VPSLQEVLHETPYRRRGVAPGGHGQRVRRRPQGAQEARRQLHPVHGRGVRQALLAAGAHVNARNGRGETPLFEAARNDDAALITTLLKAGADPTLVDSRGVTPLAIAKQVGSMRATELLKDAKKPAVGH
jgi:hypothetical protein